MARLEDITKGGTLKGILPDALVTVVDVKRIGSVAVELTYKDANGRLGNELVYRDREPSLEVIVSGSPWSFDGDGQLFRLVSEARRIRLAYLFDPLLAVHTSLVDPLPHQITAVYGEMLTRHPLRFLLADDPGAGKTIMAGLLIKELMARGSLQKCLIVCPGNLTDQWQDEMLARFHIPFKIMTSDALEASQDGNWFRDNPLAICRLDKLSRDERIQAKLENTDWDLVICDEAHKMSATYFSGEVKFTKRYHLGQLLSRLTRHFLLMSATPHNGKEADFQLFMALLDGDRFEGRFRDGVHACDASDMMRRMVKEHLLKMDGTPLFPERIAYTVNYRLSDAEADLYRRVTEYVREEFNRADALESEGRKGTIGFALTILQRRLASSPEAIYRSLMRRRERLEKRLREEQLLKRSGTARVEPRADLPAIEADTLEELEDVPDQELETLEESVVDQATAARTINELQAEIAILQDLERRALAVKQSGLDRKWDELSRLLQSHPEMFSSKGMGRKLIIFTEHRDTLSYLADKIRGLLGRPEAVVTIQGGMGREERKTAEQEFTQNKDVEILVATDAAGEGINLQRAHLMVNYDLPWNPNRIEQRFGRIHRIGQTEVCHLWNIIAGETREGEVFHRLFEKLEEERKALGGKVFDVLGRITFEDRPLRELLLEAIRYGDRPEVRERLNQVVDKALDRERIEQLLEDRALVKDAMDASRVRKIREDMERAEARKLQPHFIAEFFLEAFRRLGGTAREREGRRYELTHVPAIIRNRDRVIGTREAVLARYERIAFEKLLISVAGSPLAAFVCPGHPLLEAVGDLTIEQHKDLLKRGTILVDEADGSDQIRALVYLEHSIQDGRIDKDGQRRVVSRQMQFVEIDSAGNVRAAGQAPYLDYRCLSAEERSALTKWEPPAWIKDGLETKALDFAVAKIVPSHLEDVRGRKEELVAKTMAAVKERLTTEITYWDHQAERLKEQESAGKVNARLNSGLARQRADELTGRLQKRMTELELERRIAPLPPIVVGGALVIPKGFFARLGGAAVPPTFAADTAEVEAKAMAAVMRAEESLGFKPRDVSAAKVGYDIESSIPGTGRLRFIEVKGRVNGAVTVTVTKNEILTALNKPEDFILAVVVVDGEAAATPRYVRRPFQREPDFDATSVNYNLRELLARAEDPA